MNIGAVGGASAAWSMQSSSRPAPPSLTETAKLLGMSGSELTQQLQSGKSLDSLAKSKGVPESAVVTSVESDLKANAPAGAPSLSGSQLRQIATTIASGRPPSGIAGPGGVGGSDGVGGPGATGGTGGAQGGQAGGTKSLEETLLAELKESQESESSSAKVTSSYDGRGKSTAASVSAGHTTFSMYA